MCNKELRSEMGFYGKKLIAEKNSKERIIQDWLNLIKNRNGKRC